jgi:hypothetical protein
MSNTKVNRRNHRRQVKDWVTVDDIGRRTDIVTPLVVTGHRPL